MDRTGTMLLSGGDTDLAATACDVGLGTGLFTALKLSHLILRERLQEDYLVRLVEGMAFSGVVLKSLRSNGAAPTNARLQTQAADLLRMLLMDSRQRRFFRAVRSGERKAAQFLRKGQ